LLKGKVKWFNTIKGFGFIQPEEGGSDVFVHANALERSGIMELKEGLEQVDDREVGRRLAV